MIIKERSESLELLLYRYLNSRMILSENESTHYWALEKGYQGEINFDILTKLLQGEFILLNDLLFEINNTHFQIDTMVLSSQSIFLFDIKNFEGDYYIDSDNKWWLLTNKGGKKELKKGIKNPIHQLERCETLLKQMFQNLGYDYTIVSNLIFINPRFSLYQAPLHSPIIFPTQIEYFLSQMNLHLKQSKLKESHIQFARKLLSYHLDESPFIKKPEYTFEQLAKGISCKSCHSLNLFSSLKTIVCNQCEFRENIEGAVLRSIKEFQILFPNEKITTAAIYEWCKIIKSGTTIRKVLTNSYKPVGKHKSCYYVEK